MIRYKIAEISNVGTKTKKKLPLSFKYIHVAMSRNGGLIAACKEKEYFTTNDESGIIKNIILFHQDTNKRYNVRLDWKYNESYIVNLEFNDKEQLYGFCSNGDIRKIDTLISKAKVKVTSGIFTEEGIVNAKLCDKGLIALTKKGNIYFAPDIKNPKPLFYMTIKDKFKFSQEIDFLGIPGTVTTSKKTEILVLNEKGKGVLLVKCSETESGSVRGERNNKNAKIQLFNPEDGSLNKPDISSTPTESSETTPETNQQQPPKIPKIKGKINAMCISPDKEQVAFYCADNTTIYIYNSNLEKSSMKKIILNVNKIQTETSDVLSNEEIQEYQTIFAYEKPQEYQFLFFGSTGVALCGLRFLVLVTMKGEIISFRMSDLNSINWLESYLQSIDTPCLIVSHDRRFLNKITTKTLEIDYFTRNIREYPGNYEKYQEFKQKEQEKQIQKYEEQQETIFDLKESIAQKKSWASKGRNQGVSDNDKLTRGYERDRSNSLASNAKKIEKQIEQMDKIERPKIKQKLDIKINLNDTKGGTDINTSDLICGYENGFQTEPIRLNCKLGERIVIIGDNGSGKSTFLKTLIGEQEKLSGDISIGTGLRIGYIAQDTKEDDEISIDNYLKRSIDYDNLEDKSLIYTVLKQFNFDYSEKDKTYKMLSPGERTRLQLASFTLQKINTLVLDEPTNHLDIEALEALEEVVSTFKGSVIAISHDREFITKINPTKVYKMTKGRMQEIVIEHINEKK